MGVKDYTSGSGRLSGNRRFASTRFRLRANSSFGARFVKPSTAIELTGPLTSLSTLTGQPARRYWPRPWWSALRFGVPAVAVAFVAVAFVVKLLTHSELFGQGTVVLFLLLPAVAVASWYIGRATAVAAAVIAASEHTDREGRLREELVSVVGHDLRTPLGAIMMTGHLLLNSGRLDPDDRTKVTRVISAAERMARLISQLLDFSRVRTGSGLAIELGEANLNRICEQVLDELRAANPERVVVMEAAGQEIVGRWDSDRIGEVISNLIGNAIQYGDRALPVTLRLSVAGSHAIVHVHNWGRPIPADVLPHVFEPFRRGSDDRSTSIGLGLYIAEQIAIAHQGRIAVTSSVAEGTLFGVILPLRAHPAAMM